MFNKSSKEYTLNDSFIIPFIQIAQRLKEIGDKIDEKVKIELQQVLSEELKPSNIFQVKAEEFSGVCREVLSRCSGRLRNGWEQVAVVYIGKTSLFNFVSFFAPHAILTPSPSLCSGVRDVIRELRAQGESQGSARETMVNGFAGEVLEELRLEPWIRSQGGLVSLMNSGS